MDFFNIFGFAFIVVIMIPNIVYAIKCKDAVPSWHNPKIELLEQIGRFGCIGFMIFHIPGTFFGWCSAEAFVAYLVVDSLLLAAYCVIWILCFHSNSLFRALVLSILPSVLFLFSGVMSRSILLIVSALIFTPAHIFISCKNAEHQ